MKKYIILLLTIMLIQPSSFAVGMKNTMDKVMDSWIGENIDTVINSWGYPSSEKEIAGKKLYYWLNSSYVITGNQYGVYGGESTCNRILEVDKNNIVVKWQWEGNNCPSTYIFSGKKLVNPNNNPWKKNLNYRRLQYVKEHFNIHSRHGNNVYTYGTIRYCG